MARDLIYTGFITLDGIVDSPGGTAEGHPGGGWVFDTPFEADSYSLKDDELADTTALMFGRRSYEAFAAFWPGSDDHTAYREFPKYIVSTTLSDDDLIDGWGELTILRSTEDVAALKRTEGGAILIHGSADLALRLGAADLIDRYNLLLFPYALNGGKRIFAADGGERRNLALRDSAVYANGVVKLVYDVVR